MAKLTAKDVEARQYHRGLAELLSTSATFRKFLWQLINDSGMYLPTYRQGSLAAASDHAYQEGRRALGLEVLHELKFARTDILALLEREGELITAKVQAQSDGRADQTLEDENDLEP
jgi:hypothetical protein